MKTYNLFRLLPVLFLISCEKEDEPYILPPPGIMEVAQVSMGEAYDTQIYFRFSDHAQITNHINDWDLAFETGPGDYLVRMNGGKQVLVYNTWETDFNKNYAVTGIEWKWDTPDGSPDSVAFRDWYNSSNATSGNYIYLIDRGPDVLSDRYKKIQLTGVNADQYTFICANPDGSSQSGFIIEKDTTYSYSYFTFNEGGKQVVIDPGREMYDILFTRYRTIYFDFLPQLAYTVNGVLINPYKTSVAVDSITPFDSIDVEYANLMNFSVKFDAIGFDWKTYNFNTSVYEVNQKKSYVIKNQLGILYKLRFIGFYNNLGQKGSPKFEFQRL